MATHVGADLRLARHPPRLWRWRDRVGSWPWGTTGLGDGGHDAFGEPRLAELHLSGAPNTHVRAPALNVVVVFEGPVPVHSQDDTPAYRRYLQLVATVVPAILLGR